MKKIFNIECKNLVGQRVELYGFISEIRDHGKLIFFDLKDRKWHCANSYFSRK
jgi:aspartyl-tRNA synthetase